jgi:transcriptional regulator with XRE-family HTH domain
MQRITSLFAYHPKRTTPVAPLLEGIRGKMTVHARLKIVRDSLGMTQKDVAKSLGISPRTWQDYEGGINLPGGKVLEQLARMGFNVNWILTGEGEIRQEDERAAAYAIRRDDGSFESIQPDTIEAILNGFDELKDSGILIDNLNKAIVLSIAYEYFRFYKKEVPKSMKRFVLAYLYIMDEMPKDKRHKQDENLFLMLDRVMKNIKG